MVIETVRKGVVRVQGDKLCVILGLAPGTKIAKEVLDKIQITDLGEPIVICDREIIVTSRMKALVDILVGKNVIEE